MMIMPHQTDNKNKGMKVLKKKKKEILKMKSKIAQTKIQQRGLIVDFICHKKESAN